MNSNSNTNVKKSVQSFGRALSSMVMPNIGAFIAWGLVTALFIPTGWLPNEKLAALVGPMIKYLLPLLIGYTGGKNIHGTRGGVMAAVVTMGVIVGSEIPMFLGAMIVGPLSGFILKKFDNFVQEKIPTGFEMLVNNFSLGIIGTIMAIIAFLFIGPVVAILTGFVTIGVESIVIMGLLPFVSIFIEPAKVLFLNNAINHGILTPLGTEQAAAMGESIFFLLETNPGPGLGVLLAYSIFGKGNSRQSSPSAIIIHFFGGIHEIYFPYVLMNPYLFLAVIVGGMSGVFTFSLLGAGLVASPSPGSIFALLALSPPKDIPNYIAVLAGVTVATLVSFLISSVFVKRAASRMTDEDMELAKQKVHDMKNESKGLNNTNTNQKDIDSLKNVNLIVYACDAGMGSSAMAATMLGKRLKQNNITIPIKNYAINEIPQNADIVITHVELSERAKSAAPNAYHIGVTDFLDMSISDVLIDILNNGNNNQKTDSQKGEPQKNTEVSKIFTKKDVLVGLKSESKEDAIKRAGELLVANGYTKEEYINGMLEREKTVSTYVGKGVSMPHGVNEAREFIIKTGIVVLTYPQGVQFGDDSAYMLVAIAANENEHLQIISKLAEIIDNDKISVSELSKAQDIESIYKLFV